jgi:hypothetical protein
MFGFQHLSHRPCPDCGASVAADALDEHVCERERWLDYQLLQLRGELDAFELEVAEYLDSPSGRFELWCAERDRRGYEPGLDQ